MTGEALTRRTLFRSAAAGAALATLPRPLLAALPQPQVDWQAATTTALPPPEPIVFLVNRITFGLLPDDLAHARSLGFQGFVEEQLSPESIDDSTVEATVAATFPTLSFDIGTLLRYGDMVLPEIVTELKAATLYRAIASKRQLFEMMVDFWSNHFHVYHQDGRVAYYKTPDDRDVIRRYALGRFRDLLGASAKSPAMLLFLNNNSNTKTGPNENYAREVMELHTLSVNGGYSQTDVQEVARSFTGWTIGRGDRLGAAGTFVFNPASHDDGPRLVLGNNLPAGLGIGHGERVLDILAAHPSTANFIATKLCRRFVADNPPTSLVDKVSQTFTSTGGDIRETMRTLLLSSEFAASTDQKLKRPLEIVASSVRTLAAQLGPQGGAALLNVLRNMGQLPFDWHPPNGFPDVAGAWGNTNGMLNRWNLGLSLAGNSLPDVRTDLAALAAGTPHLPQPTAKDLTDHLTRRLLGRNLTPADRKQVIAYVADGKPASTRLTVEQYQAKLPGLVALILDSPYFEWR